MRPSAYFDGPIGKLNWQVVQMLWPYLTEFKARISLALFCLVIAKLASIGLPFILKDLVDTLGGADSQFIIAPIALVMAYGGLRFLNVIIGEIRDTLFGRVTERAMRRLGLAVFEHLHRLDLDFHLERRTGGLSRDIERGTSGISFLMRFMVFNIVPTLLEIALVIGIFFVQYGWIYALITLSAVVAYILFSIKATEWRTGFVRESAKADSLSNTRVVDSLLNYETVKYFNNEQYETNAYDDALAQWEAAKRKNRLSLLILNSGQALIIATAMTAMMGLAMHEVVDKTMTVGDFVLINAFMMQLFMPLNFLGFVYREIRGALANIERMFEILRRQPAVVEQEKPLSTLISKGEISFKNVDFQYDSRAILNQVSLSVPAGSKVAVVGDSGAGKSTLIKLLYRFYDVDNGTITIDGVNINELSLDALRRAIAIVPQDTVLFNRSIYDNILYGQPGASEQEVKEAAELAHLTGFIESLPDKWQTMVGERGLKLSGGEKQRVSIARAILKQAPILVFDEATSSLDSRSEKAILSAIKVAEQGHTSLVVAHRLSTIVDADMIVVLSAGKVVEQGTHDALLSQAGLYARLWSIQNES
ncbi:ABCB family ABC transporter ATP-binding protein/permease [Shewanella intestini]|uniref:ABC transporter ATP-binding protein/permease n=1 Tax=Shewanella intestini TaxID=2017544 RepID=A0ABS5I6N7_9GAMM|nr:MULTISPECIES: ABC transporter ATP-binding protein/permease [Shewanella]MBR9729389.1 ABC transporter ATP-binding protein/permease [Shewanella intestini]MRG37469.1 ATP-binding cassette domain-containing protein [Shewanella sp. XMDDZSB0408]